MDKILITKQHRLTSKASRICYEEIAQEIREYNRGEGWNKDTLPDVFLRRLISVIIPNIMKNYRNHENKTTRNCAAWWAMRSELSPAIMIWVELAKENGTVLIKANQE